MIAPKSPAELKQYRATVDATQAELASAMGLPLRTYEDLEGGRAVIRPVHWAALTYALFVLATKKGKTAAIPQEFTEMVAEAAKRLAKLPPSSNWLE